MNEVLPFFSFFFFFFFFEPADRVLPTALATCNTVVRNPAKTRESRSEKGGPMQAPLFNPRIHPSIHPFPSLPLPALFSFHSKSSKVVKRPKRRNKKRRKVPRRECEGREAMIQPDDDDRPFSFPRHVRRRGNPPAPAGAENTQRGMGMGMTRRGDRMNSPGGGGGR